MPGQLATGDEPDGRQPAGERAGAERGIPSPRQTGLAHAEQLDGRYDEQDVEQATHQRLRA